MNNGIASCKKTLKSTGKMRSAQRRRDTSRIKLFRRNKGGR
jgi:hypothetical protein